MYLFSLTPLQKRQLEGCLCRVPSMFYGQVWDVLCRTPYGIKVMSYELPQQPTMSSMTRSEIKFAILVEQVCKHINVNSHYFFYNKWLIRVYFSNGSYINHLLFLSLG